MNDTGDNIPSSFDDRLDALLRRRPVAASGDFASKTLARLRSVPEFGDDDIDRFLSEMPIKAASDFTAKTMRAALGESVTIAFLRPVLAAAASVAVCITGISVMRTAGDSSPERVVVVSAQPPAEEEIVALARALKDAAPLLDSKAGETLAVLAGNGE